PRRGDHLRRQGRCGRQDRGDGGRGHPGVALAGGARPNASRSAEGLTARIRKGDGPPLQGGSPEGSKTMADDSGRLNQVLTETSFLYGGNADFVEELYAKWASDPGSVEPSWAAFFSSLHENADQVKRAAQPPAWTPAPAPEARPDWLSALDGMWPAV